ncbi:hypothetical protein RhiirA4_479133 [Rhizophagus irregularis]|uniref:Uncharacterized protein n=1 Tax=Rhizophagus irregularis TaxID=588596 RepID=A0A2I1HFY8_9GLOM|nr:hypothetical protein RhiirA4_479133 [Rhizophagus irregularis]
MTDSIYLGYVDMINLLIERYAVGGNTFSTFDVKEPEEETPIKSQEKSWKIHYDPSYSNKFVEPPYLFYAAYYGNIANLRVTILGTIENIQKVGRKLYNYETKHHFKELKVKSKKDTMGNSH